MFFLILLTCTSFLGPLRKVLNLMFHKNIFQENMHLTDEVQVLGILVKYINVRLK